MVSRSVLFLDFDGVLHGIDDLQAEYTSQGIVFSGDKLLCHLPLLNDLLDRFPVDIVISSSWRRHYMLDELRGFFGTHASRVVGTTSDIDVPFERPANRFQECRTYAETHGIMRWLIIEDQPTILWGCWTPTPEQLRQVVFCDENLGLATPGVIEAIREFLERTQP
jgi:hypothetical protein